MRVTRWGEFGILCSLYLAKQHAKQQAVGAAEISKTQVIPVQYTQQILQRLRKGGVIKSVRGPHGGYRLANPPEKTSLKSILDSVEGATFEIFCEADPVYEQFCTHNLGCGLRYVWQDLKVVIDQFLANLTLATLLERQDTISKDSSNSQPLVSIKTRVGAARVSE